MAMGLFRMKEFFGMAGKACSLIVLFAAFVVASSTTNAYAQPQTREYEVKAAFLYNFAKFVEWPAEVFQETGAVIIIGVLGEDPFGTSLETIEGKTIEGRKVVTKRFRSARDAQVSHILFISSSEKDRLAEVVKSLKGIRVLTVGETERFVEVGGIINLYIESNKVRFEINVDSAERAGLKISSRLLGLAKVVR
jgi:hypothetical protein